MNWKKLTSIVVLTSLVAAFAADFVTPVGDNLPFGAGYNTAYVYNPETAKLAGMTLKRTLPTIPGVTNGISGVTYNTRSGTLFLIRNVSGGDGTIYETTLDGTVLRTITESGWVDTESICYVGSIIGAGTSTLYDVFLIAEEENGTSANENRLNLVLLTPGATTLTRTATNGTDPDNVSATTVFTGGTINNLGIEGIAYDSKRRLIYYVCEKRNGATPNSTGTTSANVYQRSITWNSSTLAFGSDETVLCDLQSLYTGAVLTDIGDMCYSVQDDTLLLQSDESDKTVKVTRTGAFVEQLATPAFQSEGVTITPSGQRLFVAGENQELYIYGVGNEFTTPTAVFHGYATLDFTSTAASAVADLTITVTGAAVGDIVDLAIPTAAVTATASYSAWVSAANTVTVRFSHTAAIAEDPGSGTFRAMVTRP